MSSPTFLSPGPTEPIGSVVTFPDSGPAVEAYADAEFSCDKCGHPLTYNGRGRKPKRCSERNGGDPECYGTRSTGGDSSGKRKMTNDALAKRAADVLYQLNAMIGTGALALGMTSTAREIAHGNDGFAEQAADALSLDPVLCKMILRGGTKSGAIALVISYLVLGSRVAPAAVMEWKARQDQARQDQETKVAEAQRRVNGFR